MAAFGTYITWTDIEEWHLNGNYNKNSSVQKPCVSLAPLSYPRSVI
jgi:hypothetical protein